VVFYFEAPAAAEVRFEGRRTQAPRANETPHMRFDGKTNNRHIARL
jgi:hypothetical protein